MTARIVRALANPYVNILAHPTGRLLGAREPYDVDLDAVFEAARAHNKAVEINASPERLDLNDIHARRAAGRRVPRRGSARPPPAPAPPHPPARPRRPPALWGRPP